MADRTVGARVLAHPGLRWGLSLLLGAMAAMAFAPFYWVPLLIPAFGGLLLILHRRRSLRSALGAGWWFGLGHFVVSFHWIIESFGNQPRTPETLGPPAVLLLAAGMAVYPALAAALARLVARAGAGFLLPALALAWGVMEWARGWLLTGFPWNPLSAVWSGLPEMMQPLALIGPYGLSAVTLAIAAAPALWLPGLGGRRPWLWPACAALLLSLWTGWGVWRIDSAQTRAYPDVTYRIVQPNIPQREKWDPALRREHFVDYLALSSRTPPPSGRLVIVWPETAITDIHFDRYPGRRTLATRILPPGGVLITGALRAVETEDGRALPANSLYVLDEDGRIRALYDKAHLVPFGEYLPLRPVFEALGLSKLTPGSLDIQPGRGLRHIDLPGLPAFSPLICYEIIFAGEVAADRPRPDLLINITNDAWFGLTTGPHQHFAQARMRAVEEGLGVIRAAQTGISGAIDPFGRVLGQIGAGRRGTIDAPAPVALEFSTIYARFGDWPFLLITFFGCLIVVLRRVQRESRRFRGKREIIP